MTAPATEKAAPIPAEVLTKLANDLLAIANASVRADGSDIPLGETCRKAALVLADRASQEERIREDERDRLTSLAFDQSISTHPYRNKHWAEGAKCWLRENGAMFPVQRARQRGDAS